MLLWHNYIQILYSNCQQCRHHYHHHMRRWYIHLHHLHLQNYIGILIQNNSYYRYRDYCHHKKQWYKYIQFHYHKNHLYKHRNHHNLRQYKNIQWEIHIHRQYRHHHHRMGCFTTGFTRIRVHSSSSSQTISSLTQPEVVSHLTVVQALSSSQEIGC